ncbi:hypothetical protein NQ318_021051 [Aromia moschata]|uniref:Uncharacterized protein n=1 Tax=Aromia moschata TaxID=1265417 RepID=A0AAV8Y9N7_9CUCU|nr:hypothetical protein NQ318_021051 [Aromia moschata]
MQLLQADMSHFVIISGPVQDTLFCLVDHILTSRTRLTLPKHLLRPLTVKHPEKRERVHHAIRQGSISDVTTLLADENDTGSGKLLAIGKNSYGRCTYISPSFANRKR